MDSAIRVYRRYLKLEPTHAEEYVAYLKVKDRWGEAARKLSEILNDDTFRSLEGKSKHQLWLELCNMITKHPKEVSGMKVDAILRGGIRKFTDEVRGREMMVMMMALALLSVTGIESQKGYHAQAMVIICFP